MLFLAVVLIPFRRRERWAWAACWAAVPASVSYLLTFGAHDAVIMCYSLGSDIGILVLLLLAAPTSWPSRFPTAGSADQVMT